CVKGFIPNAMFTDDNEILKRLWKEGLTMPPTQEGEVPPGPVDENDRLARMLMLFRYLLYEP
ncbi:MAG: hypothetical protein JSW39_15340, partial [Desulfobacterales bacterium]